MAMNRKELREKTKQFLRLDIELLKDAPRLNGCPMTEEWQETLEMWQYVLELIKKDEAVDE